MIGLFGGSFDPIHLGHLLVAQAVVEALELEELRFVPARLQPFKVGQHRAPAEARAAMVELAIRGEPRFRLERCELEREGPSYTVDTLRELGGREPGREFALVVGADAAAELPSWREGSDIPGLARIVAFARAGRAAPVAPYVWRTVEVPAIGISSTEIRARVRAGWSIRYWVPEAVAEYVAARRLYLDGDE
ncbi:MAG TPA: nicotinate-nucleotide adenylyltransferase [Gemmatimonadales bacterium]|nr:nicotinate-nucleotide adenylyltransferase [Gemmatimonadales bacterium]